ncbi:F-box/kelch-repeat protein At3g06240-like [Prunus avium]|uniref:F-box/kelch-repeat protein At3g06240-like n=1 Tax=Prunus avium TaxID=42229 RepID=A0A6P5TL95_PRUAV|nr:F-box/kelch-repeat protein At3g06240-like [Prunus avium]
MEAISWDRVPQEIRPKKRMRIRFRCRQAMPADNSVHVPEEIIHDILLLLPIKSLLKCTAVCKSWRSLIQSSAFMHTHLGRTIIQSNNRNDDAQLLLLQSSTREEQKRSYSLHWDRCPSLSEYSKFTDPFVAYNEISRRQEDNNQTTKMGNKNCKVNVLGTCNGLVCLQEGDIATLIWNPSIRKFLVLPPPVVTFMGFKSHAFGYDPRTNDYKVFRSVSYYKTPRLSRAVEIFSLARGSWKRLRNAVVPANFSPGNFTSNDKLDALVNGALHWIQTEGDDKFIVSFDLSTELFGKILMPISALRRRAKRWTREAPVVKNVCYASRYGDCLAFFEKHQNTKLPGDVHLYLWVMKDYGVAESWSKLFIISTQENVLRPLSFRKSGQVVLAYSSDDKCYELVDPNSKQCDDFRIDGYCPRTSLYCFMDYFVESIGLLDRPDAISY